MRLESRCSTENLDTDSECLRIVQTNPRRVHACDSDGLQDAIPTNNNGSDSWHFDPFPAQNLPTTSIVFSRTSEDIALLSESVRKFEEDIEVSRQRIQELELALGRSALDRKPVLASGSAPPARTVPGNDLNQEQRARVAARVKLYCSRDRTKNTICAWHDSRRSNPRPVYQRTTPAGYLDCGCTYEEALFEESLARHGVGSCLPGEAVRMDPALRNPLLRLLRDTFAYSDGEFERDPATGEWVEGEGARLWEEKAAARTLSTGRGGGRS